MQRAEWQSELDGLNQTRKDIEGDEARRRWPFVSVWSLVKTVNCRMA